MAKKLDQPAEDIADDSAEYSEADFWAEDAAAYNRKGELYREAGVSAGMIREQPKLNPDGSLADKAGAK